MGRVGKVIARFRRVMGLILFRSLLGKPLLCFFFQLNQFNLVLPLLMTESRLHQRLIQDFHLIQILGLPLNANNEALVGGLNALYETIDGKGHLPETLSNLLNGLVVEAVYPGPGIVRALDDQDVFEDVVEL